MNIIRDGIVKIGIAFLSLIYGVMKKKPIVNRVLIMSRQSNAPTLDIAILQQELNKRKIDNVVLCKKMKNGLSGKVEYIGELLKQMRYLATSKVVVLDSYNIPVSIFKHREETKVIQMWHALGSMKKFGKSILDKPEGKSSSIAKLMKMHEGYDYIFTSSKTSRPAFAEAFGYPEDKLSIMSLPRVDAILDTNRDKQISKMIHERYPELKSEKTILYAPTLRVGSDMVEHVKELIQVIDTSKYNLIIKMHPLVELHIDEKLEKNIVIDNDFQTIDMLSIADYVITDYSAITYEAALKALPIYFYAFDKDEYFKSRAFYLDYDKDMPGPILSNASELIEEIKTARNEALYIEKSKAFADKYIEKQKKCTAEILNLIEEIL